MDILVSLDEELANQLERVAPAKSRKRSDFIRLALRKAIIEAEEVRTRAAYARDVPHEEPPVDPGAWSKEPWVERKDDSVHTTKTGPRKGRAKKR
jgi:hypothetical protein